MTLEIRLATQLATVSLRTLLQKSLSQYLHTHWARVRLAGAAVPLSRLQVSDAADFQYESAIAHVLASTQAQAADTLAPQLAADITVYFAQAKPVASPEWAIAAGLQVQATPQGWLILTVSAAGLTAWQQHWRQIPLPTPDLADGQTIATLSGNWPLCDRLQLSLPMLLQWAYARCQTWQQEQAQQTDQRAAALPTSQAGTEAGRDGVVGGLLPAAIQALDQMAARAGEPTSCVRQGYVLAEQIYRYDAHRAQLRSPTGARMESAATLAAAQKVLAFVLTAVLNITPLNHL